MTKKLLTMNIDSGTLAEFDRRAKGLGITRTALILAAVAAYPDPALKEFHEKVQSRYPKTMAKLAASEAAEVSVAKADIAEWGFKRPIAPKQPKKAK